MRRNEVERLTEELESAKSRGDRRVDELQQENENLKRIKEVYLEQIQSLTDVRDHPNPSTAELFELQQTIKSLEESNKQLKAKLELHNQKNDKGNVNEEIKSLRAQNDALLIELLEVKEKYSKLLNENLKGRDRSKSPIGKP